VDDWTGPDRENPFEVLGVDAESDTEEIRLAYRTAARRHHPDRGGDATTFARITDAYRVLRESGGRAEERAHWAAGDGGRSGPVDPVTTPTRRRSMGPAVVGSIAAVTALFMLSLLVTWTVAGPWIFAVVVVASCAVGGIAATLRHLMGESTPMGAGPWDQPA
jgi:hypothetical protein